LIQPFISSKMTIKNAAFFHNLFISKSLRYIAHINIGFVLHFFLCLLSSVLCYLVLNWLCFPFFTPRAILGAKHGILIFDM